MKPFLSDVHRERSKHGPWIVRTGVWKLGATIFSLRSQHLKRESLINCFWFGAAQVKPIMRTAFAPPSKAVTAHQTTGGGLIILGGQSESSCLVREE